MNTVMQTIFERRSVRKYQAKQILREECEQIVKAALCAPSGGNRQAAHITVVRGLDKIDRITKELKAAVLRMPENRYKDFVGAAAYTVNFGAPTFIIVAVDTSKALTPVQDGACILENIFVAARSMGIGSCWINQLGSVTEDAAFQSFLQKDLDMPSGYEVIGCAALGYPVDGFPASLVCKNTSNWVE